MMHSCRWYFRLLLPLCVLFSIACGAQNIPVGEAVANSLKLSRLRGPDARPFHLRAVTRPANSFIPDYTAEIEEYWVAPDKWRRTIRSKSFEQTIIVNGSKRFEQNSADYYPKWLNDIVIAITDVVPEQLANDVSSLTDTVAPGKRSSVRYQPSSTDGNVTNTWWGSIDFAPPGVLTWISGRNFSAGYKDYSSFHGKYIAHTVETFPLIPHGDVNTHVEVADYSPVDEALFEVEKPTPTEDQVRLVTADEVEYRKTATNVPEMKWAPVKREPTSGVLSLHIVTDKAGNVREAEFITSNNMTLRESAEGLVRQWRFKPATVDGVPAEVQTTMTFAYKTSIEGDQAKYQAASYYFKRGRDLTYPRTDGSQAFHLIGTFSWKEASGMQQGTYEEFWMAPNRWRREITVHGVKTVETRLNDDHYVAEVSSDIAPIVARAVSLFSAEFPGYAYYTPDWDWHMGDIKCGDQPCLRVSMGPTENLPEGQYPRAYYFDSTGLVLARSQSQDLISYSSFEDWAGKHVPRHITLLFGTQVVMRAQIETLEAASETNDESFKIDKVKPREWVRPASW